MIVEKRSSNPMDIPPRHQWIRGLSAIEADEVICVADECTASSRVTHCAIPRSGLMLMRMTESVFEEDYYLGELPVSSAWVNVESSDGQVAQGAAQIMVNNPDLATAMAVCDAVLAHCLKGWETVLDLIRRGLDIVDEQQRVRDAMLLKTRVDFSIVSEDAADNA